MNFPEIPDLIMWEPDVFSDDRGFFFETYRRSQLANLGVDYDLLQGNHSGSSRGVLRGLHYQIRHPQGKLVRVIAGAVFDVAVDLRRSSGSFGRWAGVHLDSDNKRILWVPPGFAHGFYTLSDWAEVLYKVTDYYAPEWERTLRWDDPTLRIEWPLVNGQPPLLSSKDADGVTFEQAETYP